MEATAASDSLATTAPSSLPSAQCPPPNFVQEGQSTDAWDCSLHFVEDARQVCGKEDGSCWRSLENAGTVFSIARPDGILAVSSKLWTDRTGIVRPVRDVGRMGSVLVHAMRRTAVVLLCHAIALGEWKFP